MIHDHLAGNVPELESQLESQDFALARDHFGMTPLHRAVILNNVTSVKFLVNRFPETINARDRVGMQGRLFFKTFLSYVKKNCSLEMHTLFPSWNLNPNGLLRLRFGFRR